MNTKVDFSFACVCLARQMGHCLGICPGIVADTDEDFSVIDDRWRSWIISIQPTTNHVICVFIDEDKEKIQMWIEQLEKKVREKWKKERNET